MWFVSARLGRVAPVAARYVVANKGVAELHERLGWKPFWWHTADGVWALARRLEVLEMAYNYLPLLWQSNLVSVPKCHVFREWRDIAWQTGEPVTRAELVETDWSNGYLDSVHWLKDGPFEAVATYHNGNRDHGFLHIPILWRGSFQKPDDIAWVRQDMEKVLLEDERWNKLPRSLAGKPLAGFRATPDRRIIVLCGMIVSVIRFKNPLLHRQSSIRKRRLGENRGFRPSF